ncbi:MAG: hypothetical protein GQ564_18210 [Bacteroidales bacterium]|nr:hypothetical protein [Bacteroidales bacterium]
MRLIKLGILIFSMFFLCSCPEGFVEKDGTIFLINNSDEDIVWYRYSHVSNSDTAYIPESFPWREADTKLIEKGTFYTDYINMENTNELLDEGFLKYYFLNYDTVLTAPWERIRDENIILKKVYFETWEDLEACNFTITYP